MIIRTILPQDNIFLAKIIRNTLAEFGANKPGTVYFEGSTDHLSDTFKEPRSVYFVILINKEIVGGAGIFPTDGLPPDTCELVKMYLLPKIRGKGIGKKLLFECFEFAKANQYKKIYLETLPELKTAIGMYEQFGFKKLSSPIGNTGHHGCDIWMLKTL